MIDNERLTRAIASALCRRGYIDVEQRDGCRYLNGIGDDELPFIAQDIAREYERDEPRQHDGDTWHSVFEDEA